MHPHIIARSATIYRLSPPLLNKNESDVRTMASPTTTSLDVKLNSAMDSLGSASMAAVATSSVSSQRDVLLVPHRPPTTPLPSRPLPAPRIQESVGRPASARSIPTVLRPSWHRGSSSRVQPLDLTTPDRRPTTSQRNSLHK